ncbi:MAG TPA: hypothetical protein DEP72_00550 [Clostridiales bacterium]|nr:MAG: hypothetical protein A2Y18_03030 [Clostridiales bacterium GWD2_32_19]HCC06641.1 hypothetical protein [Clostridiales bacterium]
MSLKIFITGKPGVGKTTCLLKIIEKIGREKCVGFYTEEIRENGERVGFDCTTLDDTRCRMSDVKFDTDSRVGRYGVDIESFNNVIVPYFKKEIDNDKIFVIDEIGPMELMSDQFLSIVGDIIKSDKTIFGIIFQNEHEKVDLIKEMEGIKILTLTEENRDVICEQIYNELKGIDISKSNNHKKECMKMMSRETYMNAAYIVSQNFSKDPSTKTGTVIVNKKGEIVGIGWNKFPDQCDESDFTWNREGAYLDTKAPYVVHGEVNACIDALVNNRGMLNDYSLYVTLYPCEKCAQVVLQSGITSVSAMSYKYYDLDFSKAATNLFESAGTEVNNMSETIPDINDETALKALCEYAEKYNPSLLENFKGDVEL